MLILLNFGQNGINWYAAPLAVIFLLNGGVFLQLLEFAFSRCFAFTHFLFGPLGNEAEEKETELHDEEDPPEVELDFRIIITCILSCFLSTVILIVTLYTTYLLYRRARQVGWRSTLLELVEYLCLLGVQGGLRPPPARMNNMHVPNSRKSMERISKRMKELPIEVFKSMDDLKQLPIRELKERLRWKKVAYQHLVEKHDLLKALTESESTSNRTCSICCEDYISGEVLRILPCKHKYHLECIEKWFMTSSHYTRSPSCPYCNTSLFPDE